MTRWLALLLTFILALPALANPNVAIASAFADCKTVPPTDAPHVRYLYCGHLAAAERQWYWEVASGHLNHLSLETLLKPPSVILDDGREMVYPGADDPLFKIKPDLFFRAIPRALHFKFSLLSYRFSRVTWDKLAVQDHHLHVQAIAANEYWPGSAQYKAGWYPHKDGKEVSALTEDVATARSTDVSYSLQTCRYLERTPTHSARSSRERAPVATSCRSGVKRK